MQRGLFITLEGSEGAGKSSQIKVISEHFKAMGKEVLCLREPGGTPIAEDIRAILKNPREDDKMADKTELLLMYAARAQLVETVIKPALNKGINVICDRHDLSTLAYQGGGRGVDTKLIEALRQIVLGDFRPDAIILVDIEPSLGIQRARGRGALDRFEQSGLDFFERVRQSYLDYAKLHQDFVHIVDGAQSLNKVSADILKVIDSLYA